jgi:hypothetical protein
VGTARVAQLIPGSLQEVQTGWYDTSRWPAWVDGLDHVVSVEGDWPREGGSVAWMSGPAGRGEVTEQVTAYEELVGQTLHVQDTAISGSQTVSFTSVGEQGIEVQFELEYHLRYGSILAPLLDRVFIRRAITSSMVKTLTRFGAELAARRAGSPSSLTSPSSVTSPSSATGDGACAPGQ